VPSRTRRATVSVLLTGLALLGIVLSLPSLAQAEGLFGYQAVTGVAGGSTYWQFVSSSYGGLNGANGGTDYLSFFVDFYSVDRKDSEGARFTVTPYARLLTSPGSILEAGAKLGYGAGTYESDHYRYYTLYGELGVARVNSIDTPLITSGLFNVTLDVPSQTVAAGTAGVEYASGWEHFGYKISYMYEYLPIKFTETSTLDFTPIGGTRTVTTENHTGLIYQTLEVALLYRF
jgi:hypothetical protein